MAKYGFVHATYTRARKKIGYIKRLTKVHVKKLIAKQLKTILIHNNYNNYNN